MTSVIITRQPQPVAMRGLTISVPEPQYARLVEMARKAGRTPAAYACDLFQAAYSARCKPTGDAALDAAVAGLGTPAQASGPMVDMLQADLERLRAALARADARIAEMATEIEQLEAGDTVSADAAMAEEIETLRQKLDAQAEAAAQWKAEAMEREKDWCDAAAERDIARREAAELQEVRDQQAEAIRELMARVAALKNGHDARSAEPAALPASAPQHQDMVEKARGNARAADGQLSGAFIRSCVGFHAVGQTPTWIAKYMRADIDDVRRALSRRR